MASEAYCGGLCTDFGTDYHVTFNDKKTTCILFVTSAAGCKCISVNDNEIMWSNRVKHLGKDVIVIDCELSDVSDSNSKKGHFIASVNWFVSHFSGQVPPDCYLRLFQAYCSHYGSVLWELNGKGFSSFCISWNKGVRRVIGIPYKTHTALLGPIIDSCHVYIVLVKLFCKFVDSILTSDNEIVNVIITKAIASAQSPIGTNIAILRNRNDIHVRNVNCCHVYKQAMHQPWGIVK